MSTSPVAPLKLLIVDDEPLARDRLRALLSDLAVQLPSEVVGEAANGLLALEILREQTVDVVLADIRMPGMDGIELATHLGRFEKPPAVIFTTAYDNYAVQAFDLNAVDYLLKPVRAQRLLAALQKVPGPRPDAALLAGIGQEVRGGGRTHLSCHERGRLLLVPIAEVLYFKADLKYVTARTVEREYLLDEALTHLETEFADRFLRLHRAVLVAKTALAGFEKTAVDDAEAYGWALLRGVPEKLPVSRRQWAPAKALVKHA
ncbi:LytR/AlgR family response regulator transcription factor [Ferribacterium limneticum]|uniref:LytR/AlgR family response regulator transcription factor n=1 Tax=Ferribacterium limneticum TaxID=76259 RepID=UPI001CFAFEE2|nr:response regulator transcription factor [Ferribacterium limneticum]UCV27988.1 response regulator transcription factor [Ferribacterium limneticum]UCV31905.1 response regulator transcription factor [Ferribacterium limneticum]